MIQYLQYGIILTIYEIVAAFVATSIDIIIFRTSAENINSSGSMLRFIIFMIIFNTIGIKLLEFL